MGASISRRVREAYAKVQESWGGGTLNLTTLEWVPDGIDAYAVTVNEAPDKKISIAADTSYGGFYRAFNAALFNCSDVEYMGFFHDDVKGTIDIDPVMVVKTKAEVDAIAKTHTVVGGAYHFATGDGYWPQGRPDEYNR